MIFNYSFASDYMNSFTEWFLQALTVDLKFDPTAPTLQLPPPTEISGYRGKQLDQQFVKCS